MRRRFDTKNFKIIPIEYRSGFRAKLKSSISLSFIISLSLLPTRRLNAQEIDESILLTGIVYGIDNSTVVPLVGATISIKGSNQGTITDFEGKFGLRINEVIKKSSLQISYIGMETYTTTIGDQTSFTVYMEPSISQLDEVVITSSYGTTKLKEQVVGSIASVSIKDIAPEQPATSFDELLEGQAAGVLVEVNPVLGGPAAINIRGQGSLTPLGNRAGTSTQPLIIVDGIILSEEITLDGSDFFDLGESRLSEQVLNPLSRVGIQDIKSFHILKDAAAVGLYGADAANGVIIIETKSGQEGPFQFSVGIQTGISTAFNQFKTLNGEQYQDVLNEFYTNSGNLEGVQPWDGTDTDWFDLLNQNGSFWRYNLNASGSIKKWRLRSSIGYQKTNEAQKENAFQLFNSSLSLDRKFGKLNAGLKFSPSITVKNNPNTFYAYAIPPIIPVRDDNGEFTNFGFYGNPLAVASQNKSESNTAAVLSSFSLDYQINEALKLSTLIGGDLSDKEEDRFFSGENGTGQLNDGSLGRRILRNRSTRKWNWNSRLNYIPKRTGIHQYDAVLGVEYRGDRVDFDFKRGDGFANFSTPQPLSLATERDFQADISETTARSFFSQWNYSYDQRFFFLVNFRIDQSSVFGGDNDTAYNSGFGASWNISSENFFQNINGIEFLRIRSSYGRTGNSRIGTYTATGLYDLSDEEFGYQSGGQSANLDPSFPPNPNLGWEVNQKFNVGIDMEFLKRFSLTAEYFRDDIQDMIVSRNIIAESGYSSASINGGNMFNQGIEMAMVSNWFLSGDWRWRTSVNFTRIRNKVTSLTGLESDFSPSAEARAQRVGQSTSALWGFEFVGIDPATGRELFEVDGEVYDAATLRNEFDNTDWKPIGDTQPDFFGGLNNTFSYKNLSLQVIMTYRVGGDILVNRALIDGYNDLEFRNPAVEVFYDSWREPGDIAKLPVITSGNPIVNNSSKYVYDNTHIKLKTITLSYALPITEWNTPLKRLEVGLTGSNLYYWFREKSPSGRNGVAELRNQYPEMRTFTLNISTTF